MRSKKYTLEILELAHDSLSGAHMGINQTKAKISNLFYWPGMDDDVKQYVLSCEICQKKTNKAAKGSINSNTYYGSGF